MPGGMPGCRKNDEGTPEAGLPARSDAEAGCADPSRVRLADGCAGRATPGSREPQCPSYMCGRAVNPVPQPSVFDGVVFST